MVIYTPRLCNDVAFLPARDNEAHGITCKEVLTPEQIEEYRLQEEQLREERLQAQQFLSQESQNLIEDNDEGTVQESKQGSAEEKVGGDSIDEGILFMLEL